MLVHMVCFKYKPEVNAERREEHRARLLALADIEGVLNLRVGADVVQSPRSFDAGLVVAFRDRAALDAYAHHSRHVPVAELGRAYCDQIVSVDFES